MWLNSLVALQWRGADVLGLAPQLTEGVERGRIKGATVVGDEVHCAFAALSDQLLSSRAECCVNAAQRRKVLGNTSHTHKHTNLSVCVCVSVSVCVRVSVTINDSDTSRINREHSQKSLNGVWRCCSPSHTQTRTQTGTLTQTRTLRKHIAEKQTCRTLPLHVS